MVRATGNTTRHVAVFAAFFLHPACTVEPGDTLPDKLHLSGPDYSSSIQFVYSKVFNCFFLVEKCWCSYWKRIQKLTLCSLAIKNKNVKTVLQFLVKTFLDTSVVVFFNGYETFFFFHWSIFKLKPRCVPCTCCVFSALLLFRRNRSKPISISGPCPSGASRKCLNVIGWTRCPNQMCHLSQYSQELQPEVSSRCERQRFTWAAATRRKAPVVPTLSTEKSFALAAASSPLFLEKPLRSSVRLTSLALCAS